MEEAQWFLSGLQKDLRHYGVPYHPRFMEVECEESGPI